MLRVLSPVPRLDPSVADLEGQRDKTDSSSWQTVYVVMHGSSSVLEARRVGRQRSNIPKSYYLDFLVVSPRGVESDLCRFDTYHTWAPPEKGGGKGKGGGEKRRKGKERKGRKRRTRNKERNRQKGAHTSTVLQKANVTLKPERFSSLLAV